MESNIITWYDEPKTTSKIDAATYKPNVMVTQTSLHHVVHCLSTPASGYWTLTTLVFNS